MEVFAHPTSWKITEIAGEMSLAKIRDVTLCSVTYYIKYYSTSIYAQYRLNDPDAVITGGGHDGRTHAGRFAFLNYTYLDALDSFRKF